MRKSEDFIIMCKYHWINFVGTGMVIFFLVIFAIIFAADDKLSVLAIVCVATIIYLIISAIVKSKTEYLAMTETRIVGSTGFLRKNQVSMPIGKVQQLHLSNGFIGRKLDYGDIVVDNAGTGQKEIIFHNVKNADEFVETFYELVEQGSGPR